MAPRPVSYAWALLTDASAVPLAQLSWQARQGLEYAQQLAEDARERAQQNIRSTTPYPPRTIADLAQTRGLPAAEARQQISQARRELFGTISLNAIYKRRQRARQHPRQPRTCKEPDCPDELSPYTHASRRYCNQHRTPAQRTRRHRHNRRR
jgi:hypothetical protein